MGVGGKPQALPCMRIPLAPEPTVEGAQSSVQLAIWDRAKDVTLDQRAFAGWCKGHRPASSSRGLCLF